MADLQMTCSTSSSSSFWDIDLSPAAIDHLNAVSRKNLGHTAIDPGKPADSPRSRLRTTSLFITTGKQVQPQVVSIYEKTSAAFRLKLQMRTIDIHQMLKLVQHLDEQLDAMSADMFAPQEIDQWFYE